MLQMCALWSSIYWQVQNAESYEDTMRNSGINIEIEACPSCILLYPLFIKKIFLTFSRVSDFFQFGFVVMDLCSHFIGYYNLQERKKIILEKSNALAKSVNGRLVVPQNLLNEVICCFFSDMLYQWFQEMIFSS